MLKLKFFSALFVLYAILANNNLFAQSITDHGTYFTFSNASVDVSVSKPNGWITSIKVKGREMLTANAGAKITDKRTGGVYTESNSTITDTRLTVYPDSQVLIIYKSYTESYPVRVIMEINDQAFRWDVECTTTFSPDREINIDFIFPGVISKMQYANWGSCGEPEDPIPYPINLIPASLTYRDYGEYLPFITFYSQSNNDGITFVAPFEITKPGLDFNSNGNTITLSNYYLRTGINKVSKAAVYIVTHDGCWRPALQWMLGRYRDYFESPITTAWDGEGWYYVSEPQTSLSEIQNLKALGVAWQEMHNHFPFYGYYGPTESGPDNDPWKVIVDNPEWTISEWEASVPVVSGDSNSYAHSYNKIQQWADNGIQSYMYFQNVDCWEEYADKYYSSSIARDQSGAAIPGWLLCVIMNADTEATGAGTYGDSLKAQISRMINKYPNMSGIFYDRVDSWNYDYAHSDGFSMIHSGVSDSPVYCIGFSQEKISRILSGALHPENMAIWGNLPTNIEVCKYLDGIMSEMMALNRHLQYMGIVKPMILFPHDETPEEAEDKLKACLIYGYMPSLSIGGSDARAVDAKYRDVIAALKGKRWALNANALTVPPGLKGNVYYNGEGESIVTLVHPYNSQLFSNPGISYNVPVVIRGADPSVLSSCYLLSGDYKGVVKLGFSYSADQISTVIPAHIVSSLLYFTKAKKYELTFSSPVLYKGKTNLFSVNIDNLSGAPKDYTLNISAPWGSKDSYFTLPAGGEKNASLEFYIPAGVSAQETNIYVTLNGTQTLFTSWITDSRYEGLEYIDVFPENEFFEDNFSFYDTGKWEELSGGGISASVSNDTIVIKKTTQGIGGLVTSNAVFYPYAVLEARAKCDTVDGNYQYIGFTEVLGGEITIRKAGNGMFEAMSSVDQQSFSNGSGYSIMASDADYHIFKIEWYPDKIKYYIDGDLKITETGLNYIPRKKLNVSLKAYNAAGNTSTLEVDWARVYSAPRKHITFYTPQRSVAQDQFSESIVIEAVTDTFVRDVSFNGTFVLASSSAQGKFSASASGPWCGFPFIVKLTAGETIIYYKDTVAGSPSITVIDGSGVYSDTNQLVSVAAGYSSSTPSYIVCQSRSVLIDGDPCEITVKARDNYGSPISGRDVTLYTTNPDDTIVYPFGQATDGQGNCIVYVYAALPGQDTFSAIIDGSGETVTKIYFKDIDQSVWDLSEGSGSFSLDLSGNDNTLFMLNGISWVSGRNGYALSFDGADDYAQAYSASTINFSDLITVEAWVYPESAVKAANWILSKGWPSEGSYLLSINNNRACFSFILDGAERKIQSDTGTISDNTWYHIAGVYDGNIIRLYIDGAEADSFAYGRSFGNNDNVLVSTSGDSAFKGLIDEICVYNRAFGGEEVNVRYMGIAEPVTFVPSCQLRFITAPKTIEAGECSESIAIEVLGESGARTVLYDTPCLVTSSFPTGSFSYDGLSWSSALTLRFTGGETLFYYKDTKTGSPAISAVSGRISIRQSVSIHPGTLSETASFLIISNSYMPSDGITPCTVNIVAMDIYNNVYEGRTVSVHTFNDTVYDTVTYPGGQISDAQGKCAAVIVSVISGADTIIAVIEGEGNTITRGIYYYTPAGIWGFDEGSGSTAYDLCANSNNAVLYNNPVWVTGKIGQALSFNGSNDYVEVNASSSLNVGGVGENYSIEFWFKSSSLPSTAEVHFFTKASASEQRYPFTFVQRSNGTVQFRIWDGTYVPSVTSAANLTDGQWHHIVGIRDATSDKVKLYVDSTAYKESTDTTNSTTANGGALRIGGGIYSTEFTGSIDEPRIYKYALSSYEVKANYRSRAVINFYGIADRLKITSFPARIRSGYTSLFAVEARDGFQNMVVTFNNTVALQSSSGSATFSVNSWPWSNVGQITFSSGSASFYYKDYKLGNPVITVSRAGILSDTQTETISASKLTFINPQFTISTVRISDTICVAAKDYYNSDTDVNFNDTAVISSDSSRGRFSVASTPWVDTTTIIFSSGIVTFFYKDMKGGEPEISIYNGGLGIYGFQQVQGVIMPVVTVEKQLRLDTDTSFVTADLLVHAGDTIEYRLIIKNSGTETALNVMITDTQAFDTLSNSLLEFLSMDTFPADTWAYSKYSYDNWQAWGIVPVEKDSGVKGLKWQFNVFAPGQQEEIKFRVRIK